MKATVSGVFEDLKFKISESSDQNWICPESARKVLMYSRNCSLHNTLIPNLLKALTYVLRNFHINVLLCSICSRNKLKYFLKGSLKCMIVSKKEKKIQSLRIILKLTSRASIFQQATQSWLRVLNIGLLNEIWAVKQQMWNQTLKIYF